jgi:hypothetical protein
MKLQFQIKNLKTNEIELIHNFKIDPNAPDNELDNIYHEELEKARTEILKGYDVIFCNEQSEGFIKEEK